MGHPSLPMFVREEPRFDCLNVVAFGIEWGSVAEWDTDDAKPCGIAGGWCDVDLGAIDADQRAAFGLGRAPNWVASSVVIGVAEKASRAASFMDDPPRPLSAFPGD